MKSAEEDAYSYTPNVSLSLPLDNPCLPSQYHSLQTGPIISVSVSQPPSYEAQDDMSHAGYYSSSSVRPNGAPTLESPRIEITAYGQFPEDEVEESNLPVSKRVNSIVTLTLPNADGYRDPTCLSPASSISSRSCHSEASSYESGFSYNYDNSPQNSPWQSPCVSPKGSTLALPGEACAQGSSPRHSPSTSPRTSMTDDTWTSQRGSRPNSPCGAKRKYSFNGRGAPHKHYPYSPNHSPGLSPQTSPRLSITEESWLPNTNQYTNSAILAAINALTTDGMVDLGEGIPMKARKTSQEHGHSVSLKVEPGGEELRSEEFCQDDHGSTRMPLKREGYCGGFLDVPQHPYSWSKPKQYVSSSLPALDWQLPSASGSYSLQIEVQPKSHHRAHYETEGSRGAVKALAGGHPVVQLHGYMESEPLTLQLFIGTADDRLLRPHAFYQVHRITGKTVSTPSHEVLQNNTKVLEIPLLPENNMRAIIDCAGILKLRNSDIELRKGETDIGRKNTRVRMVFRVHINQPTGRTVSLQVASNPIECSQRSAQELPLVDKQSLETCPAPGGERMLLSGHNFQQDSKVVFVEKAQDGHHLWETEAKIERDGSKPNSLLIEIPPYRNQRLSIPVQVNFYVCNGKRKRSQYQRFTYVPANVPTIKTEPHDDYDAPLVCTQRGPGMALQPKPFFTQPVMTPDLRPCVVGGGYSVSQQRLGAKPSSLSSSSSPSTSPKLHDLSPTPFSKCLSAGPPQHPGPQSPIPHVSIIQETPGRYQPSGLYPPSSASSSPASQPSTPGAAPEASFSPAHCMTPGQPVSGSTSPVAQQLPKVPERSRSSLAEEASPPTLAINIKQEPQELDQIYLDDVNEIIRNDLSNISVHSHA
ncbi:nuclear factor of activated T-cells, cytoplasmic 1 isoform X2 [Lampris incognitus]|uniref:nuclear factor of activated T-cells, cytoplasmic 1 isoform X2 n=1 Tax=Lampris incognitus TaxID=2546036 RepID=UPI0024B62DB2|nr:nuclear factor of activated T-cells, cytoplasmic 1 isoform X2 [Lampris incognitus]